MKGSLGLITAEWDVVLGVALGSYTAPRLTGLVSGLFGGFGGNYTPALSAVAIAVLCLVLLGRWPGFAVAFAAVYLWSAVSSVVPALGATASS
jgi:hypothetical protein